jgi:hypothetical protein
LQTRIHDLLANCAGEPGVENMLEHAPPPLTANGLDMRDGHPAELEANEGSQARFSRLGARNRRRPRISGRIESASRSL